MKIPEAQGFQVALSHIQCISQVEQLISASITQQVEVVDQFFSEEFFNIQSLLPTHFYPLTTLQKSCTTPYTFIFSGDHLSNLIYSLQYDGVKRRPPRLQQPTTTRDKQLFTAGACRHYTLTCEVKEQALELDCRSTDRNCLKRC